MLTRSLDKAKAAYKNRDIEASKKAHMQEVKYAEEEHKQAQGQYIKSLIYGGLDGIITTFAVVAGVAGAALSPAVVLILGFANLIADGLSMAIGDFLSTKAEKEYFLAEKAREEWEVEHFPEGEKREMIELYMDKGLDKKDAETITLILSKNKKPWISIMMSEELGIIEDDSSPLKNAVVTFISFIVFGFIPLLTYVVSKFIPYISSNKFLLASILTGLTLFTLGAVKVKITDKNWFLSGLEMFTVGGVAATAAYGIGAFVSILVN
jgi:VIT1/CCC1 family predicted Fe2+/Mn2+ transporter